MARYSAKNFRFRNEGMGKVLGTLEQDVMQVLWKTPGLCGREVSEELRKDRKIAVTTVFTILERLVKKGLVRKVKGESVYTFEPVQSEEELAGAISKEVFRGVLDLGSGSALASFVDIVASKDPEELERLARLISAKKKELGKGSGQ